MKIIDLQTALNNYRLSYSSGLLGRIYSLLYGYIPSSLVQQVEVFLSKLPKDPNYTLKLKDEYRLACILNENSPDGLENSFSDSIFFDELLPKMWGHSTR